MTKYTDLPAESKAVWGEFISKAEGQISELIPLLLKEVADLRVALKYKDIRDAFQKTIENSPNSFRVPIFDDSEDDQC